MTATSISKQREKISKLKTRVANGDVDAIAQLAQCYFTGDGVRRNYVKVFELYKVGANLGDPYLTWCYGDVLYHGEGVRKSIAAGLVQYVIAARKGCAQALTSLGFHYFTGGDKYKGMTFYRKAARKGDPDSLHNIGVAFSTGVGAKKNLKIAFNYFCRAADSGHPESQFKVGWCLTFGEGVRVNLPEAKRWLRLAVRNENADAKRLLLRLTKRHLARASGG
jgi:uncharacterized protein